MVEYCPYFLVANTISHRGRRGEECLGSVCGRYNECHGLKAFILDKKKVKKVKRR